MDSAYDMEPFGDDCYSEDDSGIGSNDDDVAVDYDPDSHPALPYTVLSEADIQQLLEEDITMLSNVLSVSKVHSWILLCHFNWNFSRVHDEWFADEGNVRKDVGLLKYPAIVLNGSELTCRSCSETYPCLAMSGAACGHQFCHECWRVYIGKSINDGPGCLKLRCPDPFCSAAVGKDMINIFVSDEDSEKYSRDLLELYIEKGLKAKWCPAPGCNLAVKFNMSSSNYDVCCKCAYSFCWNCREEAHRPVDCETVKRWLMKNSAESENINWLCAGAWSEHGEKTGGFYACNGYEAAKRDGAYDEEEKRRERAKISLERYTHYYERWAANQSSRKMALAHLSSLRTEKLDKLSVKLSMKESELEFIIEAWAQIVECMRVIGWTYTYAYYIPADDSYERRLLEYLQGEAENGLGRLHACAEKELQGYFDAENPSLEEFMTFRCKVASLTRVMRKYFQDLVRAFETGLMEVSSKHNEEQTESDEPSNGGKRKPAGTSDSTSGGHVTAADYGYVAAARGNALHDLGTP